MLSNSPPTVFLSILLLVATGVQSYRHLVGGPPSELPSYTSPPLPVAMEATPASFRPDPIVQAARDADAAGTCTAHGNRCHIPFPSPVKTASIGVIFYPGGKVDPRSYSPIARLLNQRFGFPVVIPVFHQDIAFAMDRCDTGRLDLARAEFPMVQKWILVGHSMGGVAAMSDMWQRWIHKDTLAAGMVLLSSYVISDLPLPCAGADFSKTNLPMASMIGTMDGIIDRAKFDRQQVYNSEHETFSLNVLGANHGSFGAYNASGRLEALGQREEDAIIPASIIWELVATTIAHVASRTGESLPDMDAPLSISSSSSSSPSETIVSTTATTTTTQDQNSTTERNFLVETAISFSWVFQWLVASPWPN